MIEIEGFAFCFFSTDIDRIIEQEKELTKLSSKYQIERWYRHDRNPGKYSSFSQMVNDAIDDTDSEFMIFCNPKTHFNSRDIELILEKLSNGYCFSSVVSFGFFGTSKELIRRIGMMDERFLGGEWEDDDFSIRLNHFGKASSIWYDYEKYEGGNVSRSVNLRHITQSIFDQKYQIHGDRILIDRNFFQHKKISKRHRKTKKHIYESWMDSEHSNGNGKMFGYLANYKTEIINPEIKEEIANFNFKLTRDGINFRIELLSDKKMSLRAVFLSDINTREIIWSEKIIEGEWKTMGIFYDGEIEIRLFMDDNQIYNSTISKNDSLDLKFKLPKIIKNG
jgi:hypothetical protein